MKAKNKKIIVKTIFIVAFLPVAIASFSQGCGKTFDAGSGSSLGNLACEGSPSNVIDKNYSIMPGERTVSIAYGQQLLDSYVSCTGIGSPSQRTLDEWERRNQSLSEYGNLTDVSGAMMMAVAAVAAEACRDLVIKESDLPPADRGIFSAVNLAGGSLTQNEITTTVDLLALSCWQRPSTDEEKMDILNAINQLNTNSENGALSLCTSMLSSLAAIEQ